MPLYDFFCESCRKKFEELCSSGAARAKCPGCGAESKKVLSSFRTGRSSSGGAPASGGCGG